MNCQFFDASRPKVSPISRIIHNHDGKPIHCQTTRRSAAAPSKSDSPIPSAGNREHVCLHVAQKARTRRRFGQSTTTVARALHPTQVCSYDFVAHQTAAVRQLGFLTVIDEYTRDSIWIETARFLSPATSSRSFCVLQSVAFPAESQATTGPSSIAREFRTGSKSGESRRNLPSLEALSGQP